MNTAEILKQAEIARESGFTAVAEKLQRNAARLEKLAEAYTFPFVREQVVVDFNRRLEAATKRAPSKAEANQVASAKYGAYAWMLDSTIEEICDQLVFDKLREYRGTPPASVMTRVAEVRNRHIFDSFEVAHVQPVATKVNLPDPIVFGRINDCSDRFFIAEWGDDVSFADLVRAAD